MSTISVLIPCYNEALTIEKVVKDYRTALPDADIFVYDNNSVDHTDDIARNAGAIIRYEYRQGKGNVIRSMFRDIEADCYLMIDGDGAQPPEYARTMCNLVLSGKADMVIGDRLSSNYFKENKRPFHNIGNEIVRCSINGLWHPAKPVLDVMTGYRALSPIFVKSFPILSRGFEIETEMTIHALDKNLLIESIPVPLRNRPEGSESKLNTCRDGIKVLLTIFNLFRDYQPLKFFGLLALFLAIFSLVLFIPVFVEFLKTSSVPRFPRLFALFVPFIMYFLVLMAGPCNGSYIRYLYPYVVTFPFLFIFTMYLKDEIKT